MEPESPFAILLAAEEDPRRARIMEGGLRMVLAYGFHRTTMDDIARAAEVSRPALYLRFRNKTDIYRAIAQRLLAHCLAQTKEALAGEGTLVERLDLMVQNAMGGTMCEIERSPHGQELLDMSGSLAGDIMAQWREEMDAVLEEAMAAEAAQAGVDLAARGISPRAVAQTLLDALDGMKTRLEQPEANVTAAKTAVRVLAAALRP